MPVVVRQGTGCPQKTIDNNINHDLSSHFGHQSHENQRQRTQCPRISQGVQRYINSLCNPHPSSTKSRKPSHKLYRKPNFAPKREFTGRTQNDDINDLPSIPPPHQSPKLRLPHCLAPARNPRRHVQLPPRRRLLGPQQSHQHHNQALTLKTQLQRRTTEGCASDRHQQQLC